MVYATSGHWSDILPPSLILFLINLSFKISSLTLKTMKRHVFCRSLCSWTARPLESVVQALADPRSHYSELNGDLPIFSNIYFSFFLKLLGGLIWVNSMQELFF